MPKFNEKMMKSVSWGLKMFAKYFSYSIQCWREPPEPLNWCIKCVCRTFWYSIGKSSCPQYWSNLKPSRHCSFPWGCQMHGSLELDTAATQWHRQIRGRNSDKSPGWTVSCCVFDEALGFYRKNWPSDGGIWSIVVHMKRMPSIASCGFEAW